MPCQALSDMSVEVMGNLQTPSSKVLFKSIFTRSEHAEDRDSTLAARFAGAKRYHLLP